MSVKVYKNFVKEEHRLLFLEDIKEKDQFFTANPNGPFRKFLRLDNTNFFNDLHQFYLNKIIERLELPRVKIDPMLGILYSNISKNGFIHTHIDSYPPYDTKEFVNYRFNLMLNRSIDNSYNPIIDNVSYDVNNSDAWSFAASIQEHKTLPVFEDEPRLVLQYGFLLTKAEYNNVINNVKLTEKMESYYAKNTRNGIARSRKDFFSQSAEIVPGTTR